MDFSDAVQWWEEWQLRVLVLCSLFLQYFLFIAAALRKRQIPPWFKFLTWLAYLASDAIAIYALATLFNRHKKQEWISTHRSSVSLEVLWAPILLLHLGGQDGITAYNIEDNELWRRHVLTAVSQVTVAIYVFRKSWSGDKRLFQAAILVFVPGILKCFEKPWALKNASINSIVNSSSDEDGDMSLDKYVATAAKYFEPRQDGQQQSDEGEAQEKPYKLFVDIAPQYSDRLSSLQYLVRHQNGAHDLLKSGLSETFERLYTKEQVQVGFNLFCECNGKKCCGQLVRSVVIYLTFAAIGLFHKSEREAYNDTDVKVTYILLCCTAALEYISINLKQYTDCFGLIFGQPWPDQLAQYNLIGYLDRNKKHKKRRRLAALLVCKDYLDQLWCMKPESSRDITEIVHGYIAKGWTENCIKDVNSYRTFNDNRGQWTLDREGCKDLEWSLQRPLDESVLIWHLATDICFYHMDKTKATANDDVCRSRKIANYMAYLLFVNPEMLMAGARRNLFTDAYGELKEFVNEKTPLSEEQLAQEIIKKMDGSKNSGLVHRAWVLSNQLMNLQNAEKKDEIKMWRLIQGVWVEMLCFSAGRCRGYLHAKSLGKGGEYLSYIWLLLAYMGMETLSERLQRTELHAEGDMGAPGDEKV